MKTIKFDIMELTSRRIKLSVHVSTWTSDTYNISDFDEIHDEMFDTVGSAMIKALQINYEYEQRQDNLTGGNDE